MNVSIEKIDNVNGKITVSIEENDYNEKLNSELKRIGKTHSIPGFRKGHITMDQLRRRFGKQVKSDVINQEVYEAVINYIRDNKLAILGEPLPVDVKEIDLNDSNYTFEYEIGLTPEINVDINDIKLPFYNIEVSKEMIDEQDQNFRERFGSQVPGEEVDEKALIKGSIMELNEDGSTKEGEDAIQVVSGIIAPMYLKSKEEADKFIGKKLNDKVVFNPWNACDGDITRLASMLNIDKEKAADAKADFEISIAEIIVVKPAELNEEYYKNIFGPDKVKTEEEYFNAIKEMISAQISGNSEMLFHMQTEKLLVEKFGNFELPQEFLKKWLVRRNEGLTVDNIDGEFEKMIPSLKWQLIKERIAAVTEVKIEENDVVSHAKAIARQQFAQYGMTNIEDDMLTDYAKRILEDKNSRSHIIEEAGDAKLFEAIKQNAKIGAKSVSIEDFKAIAEKA